MTTTMTATITGQARDRATDVLAVRAVPDTLPDVLVLTVTRGDGVHRLTVGVPDGDGTTGVLTSEGTATVLAQQVEATVLAHLAGWVAEYQPDA